MLYNTNKTNEKQAKRLDAVIRCLNEYSYEYVKEVEIDNTFFDDTDAVLFIHITTANPKFESTIFEHCYSFLIGKRGGLFKYCKSSRMSLKPFEIRWKCRIY